MRKIKEKELKELYNYSEKDNTFYLDIQLDDYRDAYSNWDYSPFINRDLDDDLLEYIMSCSYEIPMKKSLIVQFHLLHQTYDLSREIKSIEGMYNNFKYNMRNLTNARLRMIRNTLTFFIMGTALLFTASLVNVDTDGNMLSKLLSEGLFIGGWVMIWEMFSIWFFQINSLSHKIKHFKRLTKTKIIYSYNESLEKNNN